MYRFDGRVKDEEWINQKDAKNNFEEEFRLGYGYLASSEFAETFVSNGNFSTYSGKEFVYKLDTISGESDYSRFYLLGNPFSFDMNWDNIQSNNIANGYAQAVICNSGNANTCNANGIEIAEGMCALVEKHTGISRANVAVRPVVTAYGDSAIQYSLRLWVKTPDYWDVYFQVNRRVKDIFDEQAIEMTYPHLNVHLDK